MSSRINASLGALTLPAPDFAAIETPRDLVASLLARPITEPEPIVTLPASALDLADRLINDQTTSAWLQIALIRALRRDPVDAVADAEILLSILSARLEEIQGGAS